MKTKIHTLLAMLMVFCSVLRAQQTAAPDSAATAPSASAPAPSSQGIVIEYVDQDLNAVLRALARRAGINLVIGPGVSGTVTIRLTNVSFEDAIKIIVAAQNLSYTRDEVLNVSYVRTAAAQVQEPTQPDSYTFNYARADANLIGLIQRTILKSGQAPQIDTRTNRIFYNEVVSNLENAKKKIAELDSPTKQVMIETRVIDVDMTASQQYGFDWSSITTGTINAGVVAAPVTGGASLVNPTTAFNFFNTLQGNNPAQSFAILTPSQFNFSWTFINSDAENKLLASPRVVVLDNQRATIDINDRQDITFGAAATGGGGGTSGGVATPPPNFSAIRGNRLEITPQINNRNFITMNVTPTITDFTPASSVGGGTAVGGIVVIDTSSPSFITVVNPTVRTSTLNTTVFIKSGNTLAVGGLVRDNDSKTKTKVPVLGDIPGLGYLFQNRVNRAAKRNILVFVTPTVIWDPTDAEPDVMGLTKPNTGFETQYDKLDLEDMNLYAEPKAWKNNAKGAFKLVTNENNGDGSDVGSSGQNATGNDSSTPSNLMRINPSLAPSVETEPTAPAPVETAPVETAPVEQPAPAPVEATPTTTDPAATTAPVESAPAAPTVETAPAAPTEPAPPAPVETAPGATNAAPVEVPAPGN
ncbi:MAG: hypothetical protein SFY92_08265 [Verrucomicrobiae bacterium]|nr:hypothetical protein [Verrucomicrobiae bacterium]